ncbi:hypothetical protein ABB37_04397 [Leptomonas pyrrhocoris]|uniref:Ras-GEF domain-containing protein n=1 Tax=Leptomonas pyrrhocoris TaxID=157538 RepID=A0A0M9G2V2_LEPPY|nr:hypothetical protein ABB37_04397 [Leptomonas pyrrhocoris]KPA81026.1 hypothetical protein ABB37_04397 [Leptomonas pyrrhocoris]|eukprot:XP_015659465.1 hypothetical protein ABB37_04397 [Leptomonas pyrrhocoris]
MFGHRSIRDDDGPQQTETQGPVMGASANSNRTAAYEEPSGIFGFVSGRFRRSRRKTKKLVSGEGLPLHEKGTFAPLAERGNGAVAYEHSGNSSSSSNDRREKSGGGTRENSVNYAHGAERVVDVNSAPSQGGENSKETASSQNTRTLHGREAVGSGTVHVASSSASSTSTNSSNTEYAPPSVNGKDDGNARDSGSRPLSRRNRQAPLPPSDPPAHALMAAASSRSDQTAKDRMTDTKNEKLSSSSASVTTATSSTSDSESDSQSHSDDDDDADSVGRGSSKISDQSEGPSSRVRFSNSDVRRHTLLSPASPTYYAPTRDVRSSLVSTMDVDVAVVRERRRQRQHQLYLQTALHQQVTAVAPNALARPVERSFLQQRADTVYQRHMDAFVESYLSAPRYRTALAQFRKHLTVPEQQLRTADAREHYRRATEIIASRARDESAAGRTGDWWRVGNAVGGDTKDDDGGVYSNGAAAHAVKSGADRYRLEKTDLELLAGDSARRARLLDDTLPWRPIDFDATGIRLEALEHLQADLGGTDALTGGGGSGAPAVGGSVNLLIEVLILTEMDVPFTSIIPTVNYTNVFLLLASLFVLPEVLLTKLIRFYRSVRVWEAQVADTSRAIYLERRILQCILVYCRVHETDLTLSCLQRLAVFAASEGFLGPVNVLNDAVGKDQWPCQEGVYCAARRRAAVCAQAAAAAAGTVPTSPTGPGGGSSAGFGHLRHYKRHGSTDARRAADLGIAGLFPQRNSPFNPNAMLNPATRAPLQNEVGQALLEFIVYLQRTIVVYYRPIDVPADCLKSLPFAVEGPARMFVDTLVLRPSLGCTSLSLRSAMTADPRLAPEPFASAVGGGVGSSTGHPSSSSGDPSRDYRYRGGGLSTQFHDGGASADRRAASHGSSEARPGLGPDGREMAATGGGGAAAAAASPQASTLETTVLQKPLSVVDLDAELLSRQICLLSFSLFTAVHIRELLNNAWTDAAMKFSVSTKLTELMEFSSHLQRWTAAVVLTPATWAECQRGLRYFLEVCRMLYEQQNYEMAAAILEGVRHPSVDFLDRAFAEARGQGLLSPVERRELETLQELMDPFASYSPSSLYSVTARTVGDMETPMLPRLSPILGVIFRSEETRGKTVSIRSSDGQAVVNWSKVTGLGKMVVLWMRCQHTPFAFPVDPEIQEFLWSTMNHQWTDALLMRAARRAKQ